MNTWILIIYLMTGSTDGGVAISQTAFKTEAGCKEALAKIQKNTYEKWEMFIRGHMDGICVEIK